MNTSTPMSAALASGNGESLLEAIADLERRMKSASLEGQQLDDHITQLHRIRLEAYASADVYLDDEHKSSRYQVAYDPGARCRFETFDGEVNILYSGYKHFRCETDSFDSGECVPLPAAALCLSVEQAQVYFASHAEKLRKARNAAEEEAERLAEADRLVHERAEYLRLHAKFGQRGDVG